MSEGDMKLGFAMQHSCELSVNAKGEYSGSVKCYGLTGADAREECCGQFMELLRFIDRLKKEGNK